MCVFYCIVYTLAPEIKFTSFTNWWTRLTVILAASWKTKVSPISVIWLHGILKCYVTFNWPWSSWCKEGAEKSFFRDAKHEDTFFLINQAHSISISAENFCVIRLALNRTFYSYVCAGTKAKKCDKFRSIYVSGEFVLFEMESFLYFFRSRIRKVLNLLDYFVKICPFWHNIFAKYQSFYGWVGMNCYKYWHERISHHQVFKIWEPWFSTQAKKEIGIFLKWHPQCSWIIFHTFLTLSICCWCCRNRRFHWGGNQTFITRWCAHFAFGIVAKSTAKRERARWKKESNQYVYNEIIQGSDATIECCWVWEKKKNTISFHQNSLEKFRHFKLFFSQWTSFCLCFCLCWCMRARVFGFFAVLDSSHKCICIWKNFLKPEE